MGSMVVAQPGPASLDDRVVRPAVKRDGLTVSRRLCRFHFFSGILSLPTFSATDLHSRPRPRPRRTGSRGTKPDFRIWQNSLSLPLVRYSLSQILSTFR